jgi:hypothetical protein
VPTPPFHEAGEQQRSAAAMPAAFDPRADSPGTAEAVRELNAPSTYSGGL